MSLSKDLEAYRRDGELPALLSKRFIRCLQPAERKRLAAALSAQILAALEDDDAGEIELVNMAARFFRVRRIRKEKGEL